MSLMRSIRQSIVAGEFPKFVNDFMTTMFPTGNYPLWVIESLASVNIHLSPPVDMKSDSVEPAENGIS